MSTMSDTSDPCQNPYLNAKTAAEMEMVIQPPASRRNAGCTDDALVLQVRNFVIDKADEFSYKDPVDGSVSEHQGIRFLFSDGSRVIFRLSGVASP